MLTSKLLSAIPGVQHGFGTRQDPVPRIFEPLWEKARPQWHQVHGTDSAQVEQPAQPCGKVDALYTQAPGIPIPIMTADCVPILLASRDGKAAAAVHAGWRGTRAHILKELWQRISGLAPGGWVAAIGPAIGPCCYEVSEELAQDFESEFGAYGKGLAVPKARHLDLPAINEAELKRLGVGEVEILRQCTRCSLEADGQPRFFSYRREGSGTRQFSVISLK